MAVTRRRWAGPSRQVDCIGRRWYDDGGLDHYVSGMTTVGWTTTSVARRRWAGPLRRQKTTLWGRFLWRSTGWTVRRTAAAVASASMPERLVRASEDEATARDGIFGEEHPEGLDEQLAEMLAPRATQDTARLATQATESFRSSSRSAQAQERWGGTDARQLLPPWRLCNPMGDDRALRRHRQRMWWRLY